MLRAAKKERKKEVSPGWLASLQEPKAGSRKPHWCIHPHPHPMLLSPQAAAGVQGTVGTVSYRGVWESLGDPFSPHHSISTGKYLVSC